MSADDTGQWPMAQRLSEQDRRLNHSLGQLSTAVDHRMTERTDLLAMVKRMSNHLASVALLDVDAEVKQVAMRMCKEAAALVRRVEGKQ